MHPSRKVFHLISMSINLSKESPAALYKVVVNWLQSALQLCFANLARTTEPQGNPVLSLS